MRQQGLAGRGDRHLVAIHGRQNRLGHPQKAAQATLSCGAVQTHQRPGHQLEIGGIALATKHTQQANLIHMPQTTGQIRQFADGHLTLRRFRRALAGQIGTEEMAFLNQAFTTGATQLIDTTDQQGRQCSVLQLHIIEIAGQQDNRIAQRLDAGVRHFVL